MDMTSLRKRSIQGLQAITELNHKMIELNLLVNHASFHAISEKDEEDIEKIAMENLKDIKDKAAIVLSYYAEELSDIEGDFEHVFKKIYKGGNSDE